MRGLLVAAVMVMGTGVLSAQPRVATALKPLAPCRVTGDGLVLLSQTTEAALPAGTPVSQPLTPVEMAEPVAEPPPTEVLAESAIESIETVICPTCETRGLGDSWSNYEFLLWWPKAQPLPPLVSANRFAPPVLGERGTHLLLGGRSLGNPDQAGGRFTLGRSITTDHSVGIEGVYFFLGTRTQTSTVSTLDYPQLGQVGIPYTDAFTNRPAAFLLASPGTSSTRINVSTTTRAQGAEMNLVASLVDHERVKLRGLAGYRFLQVHEGLRIETVNVTGPVGNIPTTLGQTADQFDAHNRFNGGQLGLALDLNRGSVFVEFVGKVALGSNFEVVRIEGQSNTIVGYQPLIQGDSTGTGLFAESTNIGRYTRQAFAVVPEATLKFGLKISDHGRFFAGYNFLYLSDAVRPGDQVDTTLAPGQMRILAPSTMLAVDRPVAPFQRTDFWMQGLVLGLEGRY